MAIRTAAGGGGATCPTCCRPVGNPYRHHDATGRITEGCIDASHTGQLVHISSSNHWHTRPEAEALRKNTLAFLNNLK